MVVKQSLKVHAHVIKPLADDVDLKTIAKRHLAFTGADLSNLLNEAALLAARLNKRLSPWLNWKKPVKRLAWALNAAVTL